MEVLFLGGVFDEIIEKEILRDSKGAVHYAANKFQWNLIDGLLQIDNLELKILSAPFIGAYPKDYSRIRFKNRKSVYKNKVSINYVSFNNIWGLRSISRRYNLIKNITNFSLSSSINKTIIVYSPHTPYLQAAVHAKKIDPSIHICLIVPDLPQYMNLNEKRSFAYDIFKKIDIDIFNVKLKYVDSFVILTEPMKNILNIGVKPYVVVEGIVNTEDYYNNDQIVNMYKQDKMTTIVYTGTLNQKFGVINLVEAFHRTELNNTILKICGRGDSEDIIKEYASKDQRIKFLGQLSNHEAVKLQETATVLVNPRQNNEEFTKYSFPSKNMEYLLTAKPVIAYKLDGIPDEYDRYFYYVEDNSIATLSKTIEDVIALPKEIRDQFGSKARKFILENKSNVSACKNITNMIKNSRSE